MNKRRWISVLIAVVLLSAVSVVVSTADIAPRVLISPGPTVLDPQHHMSEGSFENTTLTPEGITLAQVNGGYVVTGTWTSPVFVASHTPVWGRLAWDVDLGYEEELVNGGFETDADGDGLPDGWTPDPQASDYMTATLVSGDAWEGRRFFRLRMKGGRLSSNLFAYHQHVVAAAGNTYVLMARVRCSPAFARTATAAMHVTVYRDGHWYASRAAYLRACYSDSLNYRHGTSIWQPTEIVVLTLPSDSATYTFRVSTLFKPFIGEAEPAGYIDVDGVRLLRLPPAWVTFQARSSQDGRTWTEWTPARYLHHGDRETAFLLTPGFDRPQTTGQRHSEPSAPPSASMQYRFYFPALPVEERQEIAMTKVEPRREHFLPARQGYRYLQVRLILGNRGSSRSPTVRRLQFDYTTGIAFLPPWNDTSTTVVNSYPLHPRFDAPGGRHGFVRIRDGQLVFADGTPARFWGAAYDVRYCWPDQQVTIARRLAKFGFNLVKLTATDGAWWQQGQNGCLDTFIASLEKQGVHFYLQLAGWGMITAMRQSSDAYRFYTENYGTFPELQTFLDMGYNAGEKAWQHSLFTGDPQLLAFFQHYVADVLNHVNPQTERAYKDDPAFVLVELVNENYLTRRWVTGNMPLGSLPAHYETLFDQAWHSWLRERYGTFDALQAAWDDGTGTAFLPGERDFDHVQRQPDHLGWPPPSVTFSRPRVRDLAEFYAGRERAFYEGMARYLREQGVRVPIIASQNPTLLTEEWLALSPWVTVHDIHRYFDHPRSIGPAGHTVIANLDPFLPVTSSHLFPYLGSTRLDTKPTSISETNWAVNNPHAYLHIPGLLGYAAHAGIENVVLFSYIHSGAPPQEPWKQTYLVPSTFRYHSNPVVLTGSAVASVAFRRGDVKRATVEKIIRYSQEGTRERFWDHFQAGMPDLYLESGRFVPKEATLVDGFRKYYAQSQPTQDLPGGGANAEEDTYVSDTGELSYSLGERRFTLDTPFTQGAAGYLAGQTVALQDVTITGTWPEYAGVMVTSLTDRPLRASSSALIWAAARVVNTGMWANEENTVPQDWGEAPVLAEGVAVTITLRTNLPSIHVWALDERGQRSREIPVNLRDGKATFALKPEWGTLWYEAGEDQNSSR